MEIVEEVEEHQDDCKRPDELGCIVCVSQTAPAAFHLFTEFRELVLRQV